MVRIKISETEQNQHADIAEYYVSEDRFEDQMTEIIRRAKNAALRGERTLIEVWGEDV